MKWNILSLLVLTLGCFEVGAHARIKPGSTLTPRSTSAGIKTGPCGNFPRSANPPIFDAGATIQFDWEETINHPWRFEIYFSEANDAGFTLLKTIPDDRNARDDLPHQFSTTVTLPNKACTGCTLQLIQVMTENPANPSLYFSCSDLQIRAAATTPEPPPRDPAASCP